MSITRESLIRCLNYCTGPNQRFQRFAVRLPALRYVLHLLDSATSSCGLQDVTCTLEDQSVDGFEFKLGGQPHLGVGAQLDTEILHLISRMSFPLSVRVVAYTADTLTCYFSTAVVWSYLITGAHEDSRVYAKSLFDGEYLANGVSGFEPTVEAITPGSVSLAEAMATELTEAEHIALVNLIPHTLKLHIRKKQQGEAKLNWAERRNIEPMRKQAQVQIEEEAAWLKMNTPQLQALYLKIAPTLALPDIFQKATTC